MASSGSSTTEQQVAEILDDWPAEPTQVAQDVIEKYGTPDQATSDRLFWFENGPWKRSVMYRDGVPHKLPDTHIDYFEQVIDYQVPPEYYDDLGQFDGSVTVRRTRGELSAECHGEPANFLALNLAHDILSGEKSVEEARQTYTEIYAKKEAGGEPDYIQEFQRLCVPQWNNTEELERRKKCRGCHCNPEGYTATIACEKYPFDGRRPVCIETRLDLCGIV